MQKISEQEFVRIHRSYVVNLQHVSGINGDHMEINGANLPVGYTYKKMLMEKPEQHFLVLSALHANIQDVFNEYGVQIMSPHFEGQPSQNVVVPKAQWAPAPAGAV